MKTPTVFHTERFFTMNLLIDAGVSPAVNWEIRNKTLVHSRSFSCHSLDFMWFLPINFTSILHFTLAFNSTWAAHCNLVWIPPLVPLQTTEFSIVIHGTENGNSTLWNCNCCILIYMHALNIHCNGGKLKAEEQNRQKRDNIKNRQRRQEQQRSGGSSKKWERRNCSRKCAPSFKCNMLLMIIIMFAKLFQLCLK